MRKINIFIFSVVLLVLVTDAAGVFLYFRQTNSQRQNFNAEIASLQKQISGLQSSLTALSKNSAAAALSLQEVVNRQAARQKSQDELITAAVAKAASSVTSVVISANVPQLQITYVNPFGNDPFFQDFGIQIPVYQQTGSAYQEVGAATGFFITSSGYILTNKHVVSNTSADYTALLSNGQQKKAKVIYKDPKNDIAIIKIDGSGYQPVILGDSSTLEPGQTIIAIGNALGQYNNSVSVGSISGLNRTIEASTDSGATEKLTGIIQTDAAINPGNSGGPLLDLNGNVVGINVAMVQGSNNIGFAIPINTVKPIVSSVLGK